MPQIEHRALGPWNQTRYVSYAVMLNAVGAAPAAWPIRSPESVGRGEMAALQELLRWSTAAYFELLYIWRFAYLPQGHVEESMYISYGVSVVALAAKSQRYRVFCNYHNGRKMYFVTPRYTSQQSAPGFVLG